MSRRRLGFHPVLGARVEAFEHRGAAHELARQRLGNLHQRDGLDLLPVGAARLGDNRRGEDPAAIEQRQAGGHDRDLGGFGDLVVFSGLKPDNRPRVRFRACAVGALLVALLALLALAPDAVELGLDVGLHASCSPSKNNNSSSITRKRGLAAISRSMTV